jgi:thioredoxin reductase (NADPH)
VSYRRLDVPGDAVAGEAIVIVGGANSAGQAAVFFADYASHVTILCKAATLSDKMSAYLVEQIAARTNIEVRCESMVRGVSGVTQLERVTVEHTGTGALDDLAASAMFVFIGATPRRSWLPPQIATDEQGFVLTGPALTERRYPTSTGERDPFLYETSVPGVFAVGDVRAHSVKRVASAVGEGSVAVQFVHQYLAS